MMKKSPTLVCRLSMSLTTKTLEHVVLAYYLPRGRAVERAKVAEAAQAEAPHAAQPPEAAEALAHDAGLFGAVTRTKADLNQVWTCKAPPPSEREASSAAKCYQVYCT